VNIYLDCIPCFLRQSLEAARNITDDGGLHEQIIREVLRMTADLDLNRPPPWVAQLIHRRLRELTGVDDPYRAAKARFNGLALAMLPALRERVKRDPHPLLAAVRAAIAANVIDLGAKSDLALDHAHEALLDACATGVLGDLAGFTRLAQAARDILYLADNAGEIVLDRLLIEALGPARVTLAVRGRPVLNDATMDDARAAGLHELVKVIDNGSDAPGTILDDCSAEFRARFREADLIVAKGQGNFETLSAVDANLVFLFKVKCPVIARHIGVPLGVHVLRHRNDTVSQHAPGTGKTALAAG
jgi:uncharacterized protein with ATP-grasp and redox domains